MDPMTLLALLRALHMAATLSLLGVVGFIAWVLPAAGTDGSEMLPRLIRFWRLNGLAALLALLAWFVLQSAIMADAADLNEAAAALPVVAEHTRYGNVLLCRTVPLLIATLLAGRSRFRLYTALVLIAVALGLQGLIGHAGAMGKLIGAIIVASEALHLCAAGVWLGALMPLWIALRTLPARSAAQVCVRFSPIGLGCVLLLAGTGSAQGLELIGSLRALVGTTYGHIALLKIALFLLALILAALNRLQLTDRLAAGVEGARRHLLLSVCVETLVGLAIVTAAAFLASSPPAVHQASASISSYGPDEDTSCRRDACPHGSHLEQGQQRLPRVSASPASSVHAERTTRLTFLETC
jgi:putative copper export protein